MSDTVILAPPSHFIQTVTVPPANTNWAFIIPDDRIFLIRSIHFHFVAGAGGGNRAILLNISDSSNNYMEIPIDSSVAAGGTVHYTYSPGLQYKVDANTVASTAPLPPDLYLPAGHRIATTTTNLGFTDQYSEIFINISPFILPVDRG